MKQNQPQVWQQMADFLPRPRAQAACTSCAVWTRDTGALRSESCWSESYPL